MLNHITIMGRLTRDPEHRTTQQGTAVTSFTVAVDRDRETNGERKTDFISCTAWRQTAEFVGKWFRKGNAIIVSGRLQSREYTDKDGAKRVVWEVVADSVYFGESKTQKPVDVENTVSFDDLEDDDDLPF